MQRVYRNVSMPLLAGNLEVPDVIALSVLFVLVDVCSTRPLVPFGLVVVCGIALGLFKKNKPHRYTVNLVRFTLASKDGRVAVTDRLPRYPGHASH
jgi:hypothetical protein